MFGLTKLFTVPATNRSVSNKCRMGERKGRKNLRSALIFSQKVLFCSHYFRQERIMNFFYFIIKYHVETRNQQAISEFSRVCFKASLSAKPFSSYENDFDLHENETACRTHFHMKGVALKLVLNPRQKRTRKMAQ